jgi:hypothetical protein
MGAASYSPEFNFSCSRPLRGRLVLRDLIGSFRLKVFCIVDDTLDTNHILFYFTCGANKPVLRPLSNPDPRQSQPPTREPVVFRAYERTKPTNPASTLLFTTAETANIAVVTIITAPTNSSLTASHRLTEVLGR